MNMSTIRLLLSGLLLVGSVTACHRHVRHDDKVVVERRVVVTEVEPPAPREEAMTESPTPGYIWHGGYWAWENDAYVWRPGTWEAPRPGYHWVPERWERVDGKWQLQGGTWERD